MAKRPSKYADGFDYEHRFHAGNTGDVFKHCVVRAWVSALQQQAESLHLVDTHAGAGMFKLPPQGEWLQGIGLLDDADTSQAPAPVREYLVAVGDKRSKGKGGLYPGSPALVYTLTRDRDRLTLFELHDAPRDKLTAFYTDHPRVAVRGGDGLAGLVELAGGGGDERLAALIDPAYVSKREWEAVVEQVAAAKLARPDLAVCIWYPIKSLTRPRAMASQLRNAGLSGAAIDLVHTPLRLKRKRLNGSGLLFLDPPAGFVGSLAATAEFLGRTLATDGEWSALTTGWVGRAP